MVGATGPEDPFEDDRGCLLGRVAAETGGIWWGVDRKRSRRGTRGSKGACPWSEDSGHVPSPDQMYVLQPDNGPSRTSSRSPAALLDLVEAIVS